MWPEKRFADAARIAARDDDPTGLTRPGLLQPVGMGRRWGPLAWLAILAIGAAVALAGPTGFQGLDAVKYLEAAAAWREAWPGGVVGATHWAMRLPYVWALALAGEHESALVALHVAFGLVVLAASWHLARAEIGEGPALALCLVLAVTPAFVGAAATVNVDVAELALTVPAFWLVLAAAREQRGGKAVLAGLLVGVAILVRQTAAAPALLGALVLLRARPWPGRCLVLFCAAVLLPSMIEAAAYAMVTGDPLYRLSVDLRHTQIPSAHLQGGVYTEGLPLLNPTLSARWDMPSVVRLHWTVDPLLRFAFHPVSAVLVMAAALAVAALMIRGVPEGGGAAPRAALGWALAGAGIVYVTNVFVLSISPSPRYFGLMLYFLAVPVAMVGAAVARTRQRVAAGAVVVVLIAALAMQALQQDMRNPAAALHAALRGHEGEAHARGYVVEAAQLRLRRDGLAGRVVAGDTPPPGALWLQDGRGALPLGDVCANGTMRWEHLAAYDSAPGALWRIIDAAGLARLVPSRAVPRLRGDAAAAALWRRLC